MWAHISTTLKEIVPLTSASHNILEYHYFSTIFNHGSIDIIREAHLTYLNTKDRSKFRHAFPFFCVFDEVPSGHYKYYEDIEYPMILMDSVKSPDLLVYVIENIDSLYELILRDSPRAVPDINNITLDDLIHHIIASKHLNLVPTMLQYSNNFYDYILSPDMIRCLLEHDKNALLQSYSPSTMEEFDILDQAGYNFNLAPDYNNAILGLCENDFAYYSKILEKLLLWRDLQGNKYDFELIIEGWSVEIVALVRKYRDI